MDSILLRSAKTYAGMQDGILLLARNVIMEKKGDKMDAMTPYVPSQLVGNVTMLSTQKVNATWPAQIESLTTEKPAILAQIQALAALDAH